MHQTAHPRRHQEVQEGVVLKGEEVHKVLRSPLSRSSQTCSRCWTSPARPLLRSSPCSTPSPSEAPQPPQMLAPFQSLAPACLEWRPRRRRTLCDSCVACGTGTGVGPRQGLLVLLLIFALVVFFFSPFFEFHFVLPLRVGLVWRVTTAGPSWCRLRS